MMPPWSSGPWPITLPEATTDVATLAYAPTPFIEGCIKPDDMVIGQWQVWGLCVRRSDVRPLNLQGIGGEVMSNAEHRQSNDGTVDIQGCMACP